MTRTGTGLAADSDAVEDDLGSVDPVTEADVVAAEAEAAEAEGFAQGLIDKLRAGAEDVSPDEIESQEKVSRFAKLRAEGVRAKAERYRVAARAKAIKDLRADVIENAPKEGDMLVKALAAVESAAREFDRLADEHDARLRDWIVRVQSFQITGTEHGVGLNGIDQLVVDGIVFDKVDAPMRLGGVFHNASSYPTPMPVRAEDDATLLATYAFLDSIGEGLR